MSIPDILQTGIKNVRNIDRFVFGSGSIEELEIILLKQKDKSESSYSIYFIDIFFQEKKNILSRLPINDADRVIFVSTQDEPTTDYIDSIYSNLLENNLSDPYAIIGIGGGISLDVAKAIANLLPNGGICSDYQGWDLVKKPSVYKIAIPTLSGTGAEATRTCVVTNKETGLKLGMNSDYSVYNQVIMDPDLTKTVPRDQYFFTGMDAYIHSFEALNGIYRNPIGDSLSQISIQYCREIFNSGDMQSDENRSKLMVASYMGGAAIATSYVGLVHPFSAGLSVALGLHHCVANCMTMRAMEEFYKNEYDEFWLMTKTQSIDVPKINHSLLSANQYDALYEAAIVHEKPLTNALGTEFKTVLTKDKVIELFKMM